MNRTKWILIAIITMVISSGCLSRTRIADLTVMSSKNISSLEGAQELGVFEGKDCKLKMSAQIPSMEEALDMATERGGGNAMIDVVIYYKPANCAFDDVCYEVKGTVVKTKNMFSDSGALKENTTTLANYTTTSFKSRAGRKYLGFQKKSTVELDNDQKHYDYIVRVE